MPPPPGSVAQALNHWKSTGLEHSIERSCAHRYTLLCVTNAIHMI
nr:MAG TPA: hypothetical protein [Caudoviricetes sp.]